MNTFLIIIGIHAALAGSALVFAAFMSLAVPTNQEQEAIRKDFEARCPKGFWRRTFFCMFGGYSRGRGMQNVFEHWPRQARVRKMAYWGVACLAVAVIIGMHFGIFKPGVYVGQ